MTAHDDKREALELALAINENLEPCLSQDDVKLITVALRAYADAPYLHPILAAQRGKPAYEAEKAALSHEPKKTEQCRSAHEAESHAPRIREGDSGVAPGRGSAAPFHVAQLPEMVDCESCIGSGKIREEGETPAQDRWRNCMDCTGTGKVPASVPSTTPQNTDEPWAWAVIQPKGETDYVVYANFDEAESDATDGAEEGLQIIPLYPASAPSAIEQKPIEILREWVEAWDADDFFKESAAKDKAAKLIRRPDGAAKS